jgi:hypothetical protein
MVFDVNRLWAAVVGALAFVVVLPLAVLVGSSLGVPTVHWSGVSLAGAELVPNWGVPPEQGGSGELDAARRAHLQSVQNAAFDRPHAGLFANYTSFSRDQVVVETTALSHGLFTDLGDRFGGDVTVFYTPFRSASADALAGVGPFVAPSWWERYEPLATWWLLVTGFPWYLGASVLAELGVFLLWRRRTHRSGAGSTMPRPA